MMVTSSLTREQLPDLARPVVDLVERFGFKWEFRFDHPLPDLDRRIQIRETKHYAPTAMVTAVRDAMKRGDSMPPIVVTEDGSLVDGNTRVTAAQRNNFPHIQAVVIDVSFQNARESERELLYSLGAAFNARHGKGIDRQEIRNAVFHLASDPNYTATRIAALIGTTDSIVQGLVAEKKARDRAESLGLNVNGSLTASRLRTLGRQSDSLNDGPFLELFKLVDETGMSDKEIRDLARRAKDTKSDDGALGVLSLEKEARKDQISTYKASGKSVPPVSGKVRQRLGFILGYADKPKELTESNPKLIRDHVDIMERSIKVLQQAIQAQGV